MGDLRFKCSNTHDYDPRVWNTAYITGIEGIPWECHQQHSGDQFSIGREIDESGKLNIVWPTRTAGNLCLSTTTLRITDDDYSLAVELARGCVGKLRHQTDEWQRIGLRLPDDFFPLAEQALQEFLKAVTQADMSSEAATTHAQAAIDSAVQASTRLCETFSAQALEARRQSEGKLPTLFGLKLDARSDLQACDQLARDCFNMVVTSPDLGTVEENSAKPDYAAFDSHIEWTQSHDAKLCVGPLVDFRPGGLPKWMVLLDEGFDSVLKAACDHARKTVERYRGRANLWNCAAGLNTPTELRWNDEQVLRMAVSIVETVRQADDRTPVLLTIDQPWSEYLRDDSQGVSPLHFSDALIRADLGLSGLALNLDFSSWPGGSMPRDAIEISRLIDRWSMLGLPLMANVTLPASSKTKGADVSKWQTEQFASGTIAPEVVIALLMSKPSIHAVIWNGVQASTADQDGPSFLGLLDEQQQPKSVAKNLAKIRQTYLH